MKWKMSMKWCLQPINFCNVTFQVKLDIQLGEKVGWDFYQAD